MTYVEEILKKHGPLLSGELAKKISQKYFLSHEAARKCISRAKDPVRRLYKINFENNQKYFFLREHYQKPIYYDNLLYSIENHSKAYNYILKAIINHNGFIKKNQLPAYSCSPIKPLKGHRLATDIINDLCSIDIIQDIGDYYQLYDSMQNSKKFSSFKAIEILKKTVMTHFNEWAKNINLISYYKGKSIFTDIPEYYKFLWAFTAPSYISGIMKTKEKPYFLLADIIIGENIFEKEINFFIDKINIIKQNKSVNNIIPILIVDELSVDAHKKLKKNGIIIGFVNQLFGDKYASILKSLLNVIVNAETILKRNPEQYIKIYESLAEIEGKSFNLRGDVFELAVGYYYSRLVPWFEMNKLVLDPITAKQKEIDVFVKPNTTELIIVECKGYKAPLDLEYVKKYISENIPIIRNWILSEQEYKNRNLTFELWSTGGFESEAKKLLNKAIAQTKKYKIKYLCKEEIFNLSKKEKDENLKKILNSYFL